MKKFLIPVVALFLLVSLAGCNLRANVDDYPRVNDNINNNDILRNDNDDDDLNGITGNNRANNNNRTNNNRTTNNRTNTTAPIRPANG